jgi:hypothetical protein
MRRRRRRREGGRVIGRLIRRTFAAICAASLLACVLVALLWLDAQRVHQDSADFTAGHTYVWATSDQEGVSVWVIRGWRWPAPVRVRSAADADHVEYYPVAIKRANWQRPIGREGVLTSGVAVAWVGPDGAPPRVSAHWNPTFPLGPSAPMPAWVVVNAPHGAIVVLTALPPLTWLIRRQRRRRLLRRRTRLGLCLHCGYDLRASRESGRCSECGEAIPAGHAPGPVPLRP